MPGVTVSGNGLWSQGGRMKTSSNGDGSTAITISGGRFARRLDSHHAVLVCGECHQEAVIERTDGFPLTDSDIGNELAAGIDHECAATGGRP